MEIAPAGAVSRLVVEEQEMGTLGSEGDDALVEARLRNRRELNHSPAAYFAFGQMGRTVRAYGYGRVGDSESTPTFRTTFRIASCTKSFTAALILTLRDENLLDLDHPAHVYYPPLLACVHPLSSNASPTVRMLLTMSAGLATDNAWADRQENMTNSAFDQLIGHGLRFISEPGTAFEYSNLGYAILGRLSEEVTGQPYRKLVREKLLEPLGLTDTTFGPRPETSDMAQGYAWVHDSWQAVIQPNPGAFSAIGGLYSTAKDLCQWASWLQSSFTPGQGGSENVLSAASRREMQQMHRYIPAASGNKSTRGYGFGLFVEQSTDSGTVVSHSGGYPGFSSHMRWHTESGYYGVGFENATYAGVHEPVTKVLDALVDEAEAKETRLSPWPETLAARLAVEALLQEWDETLADSLFADNVDLDASRGQRRQELQVLLKHTGPLAYARSVLDTVRTPAEISWRIPGENASLRCMLRMTPVLTPQVQYLEFELAGQ